jgi:hypothetical protein
MPATRYLSGAAVFTVFLSAISFPASQAEDAASDAASEVWAVEKAIYAARATGDMGYYSGVSSEHYLGWPAPAEKPASYESIKAQGREFQTGEVIDVVSDGISVDGDTAVSFYTTHRTARPGGQKVDERYENIHVYVRRDGNWQLFGAMSRRVLPDDLRAVPLSGEE